MSEQDDRNRLDKLGARLNSLHQEGAEKERAQEATRESSSNISLGMRIGIELIVATLAGGALGYFIDQKLNTKPIFMLAFVVLGFTAGVMDVLRIIKGLDHAVGYGRAVRDKQAADKNAPGFRDDDED